jgi:hypothetical protein
MILSSRIHDWPEAPRIDYEERAAIVQYDARVPRARAEALAEQWIRAHWAKHTGRTTP